MLHIIKLRRLGVRLESTLGLNTCTVDELLSFLTSLGILVEIIKFGELAFIRSARAMIAHGFLELHDLLTCLANRRLEC